MLRSLPIAGLLFLFALNPDVFSSAGDAIFAQQPASIAGVVTDNSGAVLPGVQVTLTNPSTGVTYKGITNQEGSYTINGAVPGPGYTAIFSLKGFESVSITGIYMKIGVTRTQNVKLTVVNVETIVVSTEDQNVTFDMTDATIGNNFEASMVNEPTPSALFTQQPGVTGDGAVTGVRVSQSNQGHGGLPQAPHSAHAAQQEQAVDRTASRTSKGGSPAGGALTAGGGGQGDSALQGIEIEELPLLGRDSLALQKLWIPKIKASDKFGAYSTKSWSGSAVQPVNLSATLGDRVKMWFSQLRNGGIHYIVPPTMFWKEASTVTVVVQGPRFQEATSLPGETGAGSLKVSDFMRVSISCPSNPDEFKFDKEPGTTDDMFVPVDGSTTWNFSVTPRFTGRKQAIQIQAWALYPQTEKIPYPLPVFTTSVDVHVPGIGESARRLLEGDPDYWVKYGLPGGGGFVFVAGIVTWYFKRGGSEAEPRSKAKPKGKRRVGVKAH